MTANWLGGEKGVGAGISGVMGCCECLQCAFLGDFRMLVVMKVRPPFQFARLGHIFLREITIWAGNELHIISPF